MYVPPIPAKKAVGNTKLTFLEERCFLLSMFLKQLSRCPYLVESQEFGIFVTSKGNNLQRELTLLPELSPEKQLDRISQYYSFMGEIKDSEIAEEEI